MNRKPGMFRRWSDVLLYAGFYAAVFGLLYWIVIQVIT